VKSLTRIEMLKAKLVLLNCLIKVSSIVSVIEFCYVTLKPGRQVQEILDKSVVQIKKTEEDKFQMNIRDQTHMFDNNPFRDDVTPEEYKMANRRSRRKGGKCDDAKTN